MKFGKQIAAFFGLALILVSFAASPARATGNSLYGGEADVYDTTGQKFGSGALKTSATSFGFVGNTTTPFYSAPAFTWNAWVKMSGNPSQTAVALGSGNYGYIGITSNGFAACNLSSNGGADNSIISSSVIADGNWHNIELDASATGMQCFVDGKSIGTSSLSLVASTAYWSPFVIGGLSIAPSGDGTLTYPFVNGEIDEVTVWNGVLHTVNFTPPSSAYSGSEGMVALYHLDAEESSQPSITDSAGSAAPSNVSISPNNAAIFYSPYNWYSPASDTHDCTSSASCATINAGAYFKVLFSGTSCTLNFDTSENGSPLSEIYYRVDGYEALSPWTRANVASTINCSPSADTTNTAGGYQPLYHLLQVVVKSTSETLNRWTPPSATAVIFTGLTLAPSATVAAPQTYPKRLLIFGDSVVEGVRAVNQSSANDTDQNDALASWPLSVCETLAAECGIVGFGGQGFTEAGAGNVPAFPATYNYVASGVTRSFSSPSPDMIVINEGANDCTSYASASQSQVETAATNAFNGLEAASPGTTKIVQLDWLSDPTGSSYTTKCQAALPVAIAASNAPSRITYVESTGIFSHLYGSDSLDIHPSSSNAEGVIAPQVTTILQPILNAKAPGFRPTAY